MKSKRYEDSLLERAQGIWWGFLIRFKLIKLHEVYGDDPKVVEHLHNISIGVTTEGEGENHEQ